MHILTHMLLLGAGATAATDLWALARKFLLQIPAPDYGLVGRWLGHMAEGRFRHARIAAAAPIRNELLIGWTAHYATGVLYAGLLIALAGRDWLQQPRLLPALALGIGTVAAPFLLMQPGMGAGLAASRTPRPNHARLQSLIMHAVFGIGLYLTGLAIQAFSSWRDWM